MHRWADDAPRPPNQRTTVAHNAPCRSNRGGTCPSGCGGGAAHRRYRGHRGACGASRCGRGPRSRARASCGSSKVWRAVILWAGGWGYGVGWSVQLQGWMIQAGMHPSTGHQGARSSPTPSTSPRTMTKFVRAGGEKRLWEGWGRGCWSVPVNNQSERSGDGSSLTTTKRECVRGWVSATARSEPPPRPSNFGSRRSTPAGCGDSGAPGRPAGCSQRRLDQGKGDKNRHRG